jgi:hypothetical protein
MPHGNTEVPLHAPCQGVTICLIIPPASLIPRTAAIPAQSAPLKKVTYFSRRLRSTVHVLFKSQNILCCQLLSPLALIIFLRKLTALCKWVSISKPTYRACLLPSITCWHTPIGIMKFVLCADMALCTSAYLKTGFKEDKMKLQTRQLCSAGGTEERD